MIKGILEKVIIIDHPGVVASTYLQVVLPQLPNEANLVRVAVNEEHLEIIQIVVFKKVVNKGVGCQRFRLELRTVETRRRHFLLGFHMLLQGFR